MSQLKRTQLYEVHVAAGADMVDFGGWEMPIQYPDGIVAEHLYTRHACSLFDVSHMGRLLVEGNGTVLGFRGAEATPLNLADILRFYGEDKEVRAQTAAGLYTVRQRLYELEERLAALRFARISHSEIVNLRQVTALDLTLTGTIRITLSDGTVCWASRRYVKRIKEVLGL